MNILYTSPGIASVACWVYWDRSMRQEYRVSDKNEDNIFRLKLHFLLYDDISGNNSHIDLNQDAF